MIEPFVLKGRESLPSETKASEAEKYDPVKQIWVDAASGKPLVEAMAGRSTSSQFGETVLTETSEGVDCTEMAQLQASQFGETVMTKSIEGVDQVGESPVASQFGETVHTATKEGVDTSEGTSTSHASHPFI